MMSLFQQMQNNNTRKRKPPKKYSVKQENNRESLKTCGMLLIQKMMMRIAREGQGNKKLCMYMDEMLHSIFFLGYIYEHRLTPREFFNVPKVLETVSSSFSEPFKKYSSHLPTRTPFSILLDMMEILYSTERLKEELLHLLKEMKFPNPLHKPGSKQEQYYTLESTVICECSDSDLQKHYGASLCCRKGAAKEILIDLSCLQLWHKYVSHAVMSFSSGGGDGITFPGSLRCQAYVRNWKRNVYEEKQPCSNCGRMFNLQDANPDKVEYPFGNCAETECLSKLLINNQYMREYAVINNHTDENLEKLRSSTKARLMKQLGKVGIEVSDNNLLFYDPFQMQTGD